MTRAKSTVVPAAEDREGTLDFVCATQTLCGQGRARMTKNSVMVNECLIAPRRVSV